MLAIVKTYHYLKNRLLCLLMVLCCYNSKAQIDSLNKMQDLLQNKKYEQAVILGDKIILHPDTKNEPASWSLRAVAYNNFYKQLSLLGEFNIDLVDSCLKYAMTSINLDANHEYEKDNRNLIENCAIKYNKFSRILLNDTLNTQNYPKGETIYNKYKKTTLILNPNFDFKDQDFEIYNVIGGRYLQLYYTANYDPKYEELAKTYLFKAHDIDPNNADNNMKIGTLFYNRGVALINNSDYVDLTQVDVLQENAKKLFKQSYNFINKVYELNPRDIKALDGLEGIYHALLDKEKETEFRLKKEALNKNK